MFRIHVMVTLLARNGVMGLSRWLHLPFPPFEGLALYGLTTAPDRPETVELVAWDVAEEYFHVELLGVESDESNLAELIDSYGPGWELHEPGTEPVWEP